MEKILNKLLGNEWFREVSLPFSDPSIPKNLPYILGIKRKRIVSTILPNWVKRTWRPETTGTVNTYRMHNGTREKHVDIFLLRGFSHGG